MFYCKLLFNYGYNLFFNIDADFYFDDTVWECTEHINLILNSNNSQGRRIDISGNIHSRLGLLTIMFAVYFRTLVVENLKM